MSVSSDMSLMELLFDREDPLLKDSIKEEALMEESCRDDAIVTEEWPTNPDDFLDSIFKLDNQFSLIDNNELEAIPSSSSDSGLSSALSLSCEQQLSPLLTIEEDQMEFAESEISSPQNFVDFDSLGSPNQSLTSMDSPVRSVFSSNMGSPIIEDNIDEMEFQPTVVGLVNTNEPLVNQESQQHIKFNVTSKPAQVQTPSAQEATLNLRNLTCNGKRNIRQLIRVTPVGSGNPRSILLPVSLKDMKEVRTIKIINASQARNLKGFKINHGSVIGKSLSASHPQQQTHLAGNVPGAIRCRSSLQSFDIVSEQIGIKQQDDSGSEKGGNSSDEVSETDSPYPRLKLNSEEKRLLQKEGITLPSHYPLTKHEERELKRIRRKIRNKISAQDSRKRKKEYVDGLEDRVKQCTEENMTLLKRIKALQTQNQSLAGQLKRLQALIQKGNKSAQPATCLMVLLLSLALVAVPNLRPHSGSNSNDLAQDQEQPEKMPPLAGRSRSLLFTKQLMDEELQQYGEELLQEVEGLLDHDYSPVVQVPPHKRARYEVEPGPKYSPSSDHVGGTLLGLKTERNYIEPPLDDVWPPPPPPEPPTIGKNGLKTVDKLEALTNELKINISDADGTRTVLLKVPNSEQ
ncbi:cyclic AMP response element-binding protein A [Cephus cinctus]|uniref:Cyclic AMP response element-binding protein A n=1 Tax=Cephus cinctus TaxID=211228 RepID=A0AAJ7FJE3_CEPCN|nr:cyclic AMP response element-binding protein A [Cephus cinctus]